MSLTPSLIALLVLCAFVVGFAKGGLGSLVLVVVPILSSIMTVQEALGLALPMLLVGDALATAAYWRQWDPQVLWWMVPAGVIGTVAGTYVLIALDDTTLRRIIGVMTLLYVVYRLA
ncbi:MAG: sulfite exporter TauE/SafE family protein, partial [Chloroflexota bacterium]